MNRKYTKSMSLKYEPASEPQVHPRVGKTGLGKEGMNGVLHLMFGGSVHTVYKP